MLPKNPLKLSNRLKPSAQNNTTDKIIHPHWRRGRGDGGGVMMGGGAWNGGGVPIDGGVL